MVKVVSVILENVAVAPRELEDFACQKSNSVFKVLKTVNTTFLLCPQPTSFATLHRAARL